MSFKSNKETVLKSDCDNSMFMQSEIIIKIPAPNNNALGIIKIGIDTQHSFVEINLKAGDIDDLIYNLEKAKEILNY